MKMGFRPVGAASLKRDERLKQLIKAEQIVETDRTKFEELCEKFRNCCEDIRVVLGTEYFLGSYDEIEAIMDNATIQTDARFQALYNKLNVLNSSAKHEGEKLGYHFAEWWKYCWRDKLAELASKPVESRTES